MTDFSSGFDVTSQYPDYIDRLFHIESGGNPNAATGSNRGLGQFGPQEEARYGITDANRGSYNAQAAAVALEAAEHAQALQKSLGRPPTAGELYLTHQQGVAGGPALLSANPDQPAWMAIRPYYKSDAIAQKAISGNIPSDNPLYRTDVNQITAGDFRNLWINKFEGGRPGTAVAAAPAGGLGHAAALAQPAAGGGSASLQPSAVSQAPGSLTPDQTGALLQAEKLIEEPELKPAPAMALPVNPSRLRNVIAGKAGGASGIQMPPSVKQRLAALMGKMQG